MKLPEDLLVDLALKSNCRIMNYKKVKLVGGEGFVIDS
jgi:hypothetical protein